jgi:perosamine synthetase
MTARISRRKLIAGTIALTAAANSTTKAADDPKKTVAQVEPAKAITTWPQWDTSDADGLVTVLNSGRWGRLGGNRVAEFEQKWRETMQARFCIATSSGTTALLTALGALNIGPGDEVILPPYTFVATFNAITNSYALPIFVDVDRESFQIDPSKIAAAVTANTKLIVPVHIGGTPVDIDGVMKIANEKKIPVVEDACQAALAAWRGKPVGTHGLGGCFSFQASKNLTAGEGGAIVTNDEKFAHQCYNFHTPGGGRPVASLGRGANFRLTEFQGSILLTQLARLQSQAKRRDENAAYLSNLLTAIPGIHPAKLYEGCDRSAWHLYMFRYDATQFSGLTREAFLQELRKEGIGASAGYSSLNQSTHVLAIANNPHYQRIYGREFMENWSSKNLCPVNDQLCTQAVWFSQNVLLGERTDMEKIATSIENIQSRASKLAS